MPTWLQGIHYTPIDECLWLGQEDGGLGWTKQQALLAEQWIGWVALAAGTLTLVRPCLLFTGLVVLVHAILLLAMFQVDYGVVPEGPYVSPFAKRVMLLLASACRLATPLALLLIDPWWRRQRISATRVHLGMQILRLSVAVTFAVHGLKALLKQPDYIDLILDSARRLAGWELSQDAAQQALVVIGCLDLLCALLILGTRWRVVLIWSAVWGGLTAASRISAYGFDYNWHKTAIRTSHCLAPLALAYYWMAAGRLSASESKNAGENKESNQATAEA